MKQKGLSRAPCKYQGADGAFSFLERCIRRECPPLQLTLASAPLLQRHRPSWHRMPQLQSAAQTCSYAKLALQSFIGHIAKTTGKKKENVQKYIVWNNKKKLSASKTILLGHQVFF